MRSPLLALALVLTVADASAQLRLPLVLSDGAVLQRDHSIPVWGWATPGAEVAVRLGAGTAEARAGADGHWRTTLPAMPAGGPHTLVVTSGGDRVEAADLLVGDVWVLSGQSNMEWVLRDADDAVATIATADDDRIRHFKVPRSFATEPQNDLTGGAWAVGSPETVGEFSAVGVFFARAVRQHHDVAIGLLHTSWGGSRIEPWMSADMLGLSRADVEAMQAEEQARQDALADRLRARIGDLPTEDAGMDGDVPLWADPDLDDRSWDQIHVPSLWEDTGYPGLDGVAWVRTAFALSADQAAQGVTLGLGTIDDDDVTWVNGVEVGRMVNGWNRPRRYAVPAEALRAGANTLAVRVTDNGWGGGIAGAEDLVYLETADGQRRSLVGDWRFRVAVVRLDADTHKNQEPTVLWNQMVYPLTAQPVAGVLWYQGESNGGSMEDAAAYGDQFRTLIEGWRAAWSDDDLPFLWAQLAAFHPPPTGPEDTGVWPTVREGQSSALALDRTAEAVLLDVGEADDIHPRDKRSVGERLALAARAMVYGEDGLVTSGPRYRDHAIEGDRVAVSFDHVGGGLGTRDGLPLGGFALAGSDGRWHDADARIEGDRVVASTPAVRTPVAVRYAWANNPVAATLVNAEGLPAAPFRTRE
ncbi:sialate O-acetylesterase [Rubrivirga sp.]|uniref:sialate O-acetylesterase n=1 Tax=Rubrivirga sp. TaxID=1885344 RepID=UPI003B51A733